MSIRQRAIAYLLKILKDEPVIRYSRFYDGAAETRLPLITGMGLTEADADHYGVEGVMDEAVWELEQQGVVTQRILEEKLADDEPDYEIALTSKGRAALDAKV